MSNTVEYVRAISTPKVNNRQYCAMISANIKDDVQLHLDIDGREKSVITYVSREKFDDRDFDYYNNIVEFEWFEKQFNFFFVD